MRTLFEVAHLDKQPVEIEPYRSVKHSSSSSNHASFLLSPQYACVTNRSCAGNLVITCTPSPVTTTSSSIRAAENPSDAGQYVSNAKTIPH